MTARARLILDPPASGSWNMSVDQALLESADQSGQTTFRLYRWESPTLSLGYFQNVQDRTQHTTSGSCELIRRHSGGGAILHHHELTYSLCVPSHNRWSNRHAGLYDEVHKVMIGLLNEWGVASALHAEMVNTPVNIYVNPKSFLCFQRRTAGDIVCEGYKICGSAQRRQKSSLLQHGSLLLQKSEHAPELPGIKELTSVDLVWLELAVSLGRRVQELLSLEFVESNLSESEHRRASEIQGLKFGHSDWTHRR